MSIAAEELLQISAQLGKRPRHVLGVAARCPAGHPCVITTYPLRLQRGQRVPFPTLYWLTCPALSRAVANIERAGAIATVEAALAADAGLRDTIAAQHEQYAAQRLALLTPEDRDFIDASALRDDFATLGIGGMRSRTAVKCLHLHVAHELASANAIGAWVMQRYAIKPCAQPCAAQPSTAQP